MINVENLKRKREQEETNLDSFFNFSKNKKKKLSQCSSVSRSEPNGSVAYLSAPSDTLTSTHLIKIEVYDLKEIEKIPQSQHWKHAKTRVKYYTSQNNDIYDKISKTIYNITKEISVKESCKKLIFNNKD